MNTSKIDVQNVFQRKKFFFYYDDFIGQIFSRQYRYRNPLRWWWWRGGPGGGIAWYGMKATNFKNQIWSGQP
jgi:hypothetical protein